MNFLRNIIGRLQGYRQFRILYSNIYPIIKRFGIINILKRLEKEGAGDPWIHNKDDKKFEILHKKYPLELSNLVILKKNYTFGFLLFPNSDDLKNIDNSCRDLDVNYIIYDIRNPTLYDELRTSECDGIFIIPAHENNNLRTFFHEAAHILNYESKLKIYPTILELDILEAKRTLANFLVLNNIPHPATFIFYDHESARNFIEIANFPLVFKTHVGSSANGVEILKTKQQALRLARQIFKKYYLRKMEIEKRSIEWGYMLLQEYIKDVKEFRIIMIGDSWFGYQKWKTDTQTFMSGSGVNKWINPSEDLLNFCFNIANKYHFTAMCFDIFENKNGDLLVNELQTWFGSYNPSQMYLKDGTPGRYRKINGNWIFEPGLFNTHGSILLRIIHLISLIQQEEY